MSQFNSLLNGIKVLDLSRIIVGPYATMILSDYGASVTKVQHPMGDQTRRWGPPFKNGFSTYFLSINRNKKSVCLDLKQRQGQQILYRLAEKSDILVENFVPGVTSKLKIDFQQIIKINPNIVYCSISGYGDIGPKAHNPAFDQIMQGEVGFMHITGDQDTQPYKMGFAVTDVLTGLNAASAIIGGLHYRNTNNKGIHIKTSLMESGICALINQASNHLNADSNPQRMGNHHPNIVPYGVYKCSDRYITLCIGNEQHFKSLCAVLKIEVEDRFNANSKRVSNRKQINQLLNRQFSKWTASHLLSQLAQHKVPCGSINDFPTLFDNEQVKALNLVKEVVDTDNQVYKFLRSPITTNENNIVQPTMAPKLGQHTQQILLQLGIDQDEIQRLRQRKII